MKYPIVYKVWFATNFTDKSKKLFHVYWKQHGVGPKPVEIKFNTRPSESSAYYVEACFTILLESNCWEEVMHRAMKLVFRVGETQVSCPDIDNEFELFVSKIKGFEDSILNVLLTADNSYF